MLPVPGHTRGSVMYLLDETYLFTGDSLAWNLNRRALEAFRDVCWYDWPQQAQSLHRLETETFTWVIAGHGGSVALPLAQMRAELAAFLSTLA